MTMQPLANAELAVMDLLWGEECLTSRAIREKLYPDSQKAQHGTVQRLLQRLEEKGYVERDKTLSVHLLSAAITREAYASNQMASLAEKLTGGSIMPLIVHLIEEKKISLSELRQLSNV